MGGLASKLPREPSEPANDPDFVDRPFIGAVERVVGQNADLGRPAVGHMLQSFGDEPHAVMKDEDEGEWNARKHGGPKRRVWRKIHLGVDEETLEVRAVEITGSRNIGDAPILLDQIPPYEEIESVIADSAYDTRKCYDAIADRRAHAVIPPRKNAKPWKTITAGAVARNEAPLAPECLGRAI